LRVVASLASHLIVMRHGKVVEEGPAMELFRNPKSDYTRADRKSTRLNSSHQI